MIGICGRLGDQLLGSIGEERGQCRTGLLNHGEGDQRPVSHHRPSRIYRPTQISHSTAWAPRQHPQAPANPAPSPPALANPSNSNRVEAAAEYDALCVCALHATARCCPSSTVLYLNISIAFLCACHLSTCLPSLDLAFRSSGWNIIIPVF